MVRNKDKWTTVQMLTNDRFTTQKAALKDGTHGHFSTKQNNSSVNNINQSDLLFLPMQGVYFQAILSQNLQI